MNAPLHIVAACAAVLALPHAAAAEAEDIIATLSKARVSITSGFFGGSLVVFGAVKTGGAPVRAYDLVATAVGPREGVTAWRKGRIAEGWYHKFQRQFVRNLSR